jgi:hypothetical protein
MEARIGHLEKAPSPMVFKDSGKLMNESRVQSENAYLSIVVTDFGNRTKASEEQPEKAYLSIVVIDELES